MMHIRVAMEKKQETTKVYKLEVATVDIYNRNCRINRK